MKDAKTPVILEGLPSYLQQMQRAGQSFPLRKNESIVRPIEPTSGTMHFASLHDALNILLHFDYIPILVMGATYVASKGSSKFVELAAEDLYEWLKGKIFSGKPRRAAPEHDALVNWIIDFLLDSANRERALAPPNSENRGVRFYIRSGTGQQSGRVFDIVFTGHTLACDRGPITREFLALEFRPFRHVIVPLLYQCLTQAIEIQDIFLQSRIGPCELKPSWSFSFEGVKRTWLRKTDFVVDGKVSRDGVLESLTHSSSFRRLSKRALKAHPPFLLDSHNTVHWRDCEVVSSQGMEQVPAQLEHIPDRSRSHRCSRCFLPDD